MPEKPTLVSIGSLVSGDPLFIPPQHDLGLPKEKTLPPCLSRASSSNIAAVIVFRHLDNTRKQPRQCKVIAFPSNFDFKFPLETISLKSTWKEPRTHSFASTKETQMLKLFKVPGLLTLQENLIKASSPLTCNHWQRLHALATEWWA
ncbi:hypothetical protein MRB53_034724 [Persea americana]|uniref:Uncharacterized protein n=1 Tax=Persea americana TaxID=3435 RepID=A0ACC2K2V8_PERAE|nr:hypothetical protein MRB53_034724 [Persea americana]